MKQQIANRLGVAHVRDTVMQFTGGAMTREQAMASLGVGKTRLYELRTSFLAARASGDADAWEPSRSGGNHMPAWPDEAQRFLKRVHQVWQDRLPAYAAREGVTGDTPLEDVNGTRVWVCRHVDGTISLVLNKPDLSTAPQVVFTTNPRVKRS